MAFRRYALRFDNSMTQGLNFTVQIYNSRHESIGDWTAHDHLILASFVTTFRGNDIYVTGGNDGCIAVWDINQYIHRPSRGFFFSNGKRWRISKIQLAYLVSIEQLVLSLEKLVSYRTISSRPEYAQDCRRGASYLRNIFKQFGAETDLFNTGDQSNPIVFARFRGTHTRRMKGKTILFYGHYDVVAADNKDLTWLADPFQMQGINGYLYGRGVSDNKGPVMAAIYAVADIVNKCNLHADILFLIEGEEESGSQGFQQAIKKNKHTIGHIDWILLANSYWLNDDIPCLTYGLRGVVRATVEITSERPDLHSGVDGSQLINEALKDLIALLSGLTGPNGEVNIPGFYDDIPPLTKGEQESYQAISELLLQHDSELGDRQSLTDSFKARWRYPSLTIHRVRNSGPSNTTIISRAATADLSIRLVPNQRTTAVQGALQKVLEESFNASGSANEMTIEFQHQAEPWLGDPSNEIFRVLEKAIIEVWALGGKERRKSIPSSKRTSKDLSNGLKSPKLPPVTSSTLSKTSSGQSPGSTVGNNGQPWQKPLYIREGGSIPAIRFLEQEFNAPAAHLPCGQASDSAHLDNERLRLLNLYNSRDIFRIVFEELPFR